MHSTLFNDSQANPLTMFPHKGQTTVDAHWFITRPINGRARPYDGTGQNQHRRWHDQWRKAICRPEDKKWLKHRWQAICSVCDRQFRRFRLRYFRLSGYQSIALETLYNSAFRSVTIGRTARPQIRGKVESASGCFRGFGRESRPNDPTDRVQVKRLEIEHVKGYPTTYN